MIPSINHAVLTLVLTLLKEGNIRQCEALGFTQQELSELNRLTLDELFYLSRTASQFMTVSIQHEILQRMLAQARQEIIAQARITRAIMLGGSIELLNHFFGLSSLEISARRRLLGVTVSQGRTQHPTEQEDAQLWRLWQCSGAPDPDSLEGLEQMMAIVEKMSAENRMISLTMVWSRIQRWKREQVDG